MKEMPLIYVVVAFLSFTKGQYTGKVDKKYFLFLFNKETVAFYFTCSKLHQRSQFNS